MARKPKIIKDVTISGIADKGKGVGRNPEGQVLFVEDVVPGDVVDVLVKRKKKGVMMGFATEYHHLSEDRVAPACQHFNVCGGCKWQHLSYPAQLQHKEKVVRDAITRLAKVDVDEFYPILGCEEEYFYRNKMEFSFSDKRWLEAEELNTGISNEADVLGFHRPGAWDKIVDIEKCHLQYEPSNKIRNGIRELAKKQGLEFFDIRGNKGFLRNVMFRITSQGEVLLLFAFYKKDDDKIKLFFDALLGKFPEITTLYYCINNKQNDYLNDLDMTCYHGKGYVEERLRHVKFRVGPKSFFQTNTRQAENLYDIVVKFAGLDGTQNVYDLYTGVGSIALYLAKTAKHVVGIEEIEAAIEDAKLNSALNEIDNCTFYAGDVKAILTEEFATKHGAPDLVITDPPRAGMHAKVVEMFLQLAAPKIVYVSCNPATQARDLAILSEKYNVTKLQPVDMFPHTHHIETVALLELKK